MPGSKPVTGVIPGDGTQDIAMPPLPEDQKMQQQTVDGTGMENLPETQMPQEEPQAEASQLDSRAKNFEALRLSKERAEKERDEALRMMREMQSLKGQKKYEEKLEGKEPEQQSFGLNPDDLVEGKHLSAYDKRIRELESKLERQYKQAQQQAIEAKLKAEYPDFDNVVNIDNINALRSAYPELAHTINSSTDLYSKAVSAYTLIKNMGLYRPDTYQKEKQQVAKNAAKPRPVSSVAPQEGDSPMSRANAFAEGLTDDLKKKLYQEMQELRKRY